MCEHEDNTQTDSTCDSKRELYKLDHVVQIYAQICSRKKKTTEFHVIFHGYQKRQVPTDYCMQFLKFLTSSTLQPTG